MKQGHQLEAPCELGLDETAGNCIGFGLDCGWIDIDDAASVRWFYPYALAGLGWG